MLKQNTSRFGEVLLFSCPKTQAAHGIKFMKLIHLKAIEWQIADFQPQNYIEQLYDLHLDIQRDGYWDEKQHRFLIHARAI